MKTEMKKCVRCGKEYPATREYFHLNQGRLRAECKHCTNEMARKRAFEKRAKEAKTGLDAYTPRDVMRWLASKGYEGVLTYLQKIDITKL